MLVNQHFLTFSLCFLPSQKQILSLTLMPTNALDQSKILIFGNEVSYNPLPDIRTRLVLIGKYLKTTINPLPDEKF